MTNIKTKSFYENFKSRIRQLGFRQTICFSQQGGWILVIVSYKKYRINYSIKIKNSQDDNI